MELYNLNLTQYFIGLIKDIKVDSNFEELYNRIKKLPFVPLDEISNVYESMMKNVLPLPEKQYEFVNYFNKNYMNDSARFKREIWNHHENYGK